MQKFARSFVCALVALLGLVGCGGGGVSTPAPDSPSAPIWESDLQVEVDSDAYAGWWAPRVGQQVLDQFIVSAPESEGVNLWWLDFIVAPEFQFDQLDVQVGGERVYSLLMYDQITGDGMHLLRVRFDGSAPPIPAGKQAIVTVLISGLQEYSLDPYYVNNATICTGVAVGEMSGNYYEINAYGLDGFINPEDSQSRDEERESHLSFYMLTFLLNMNQNGGMVVGGDPLPTVPTPMSSAGYDITKLVGVVGSWPRPLDPLTGYYYGADNYDTGYVIVYNPMTNQITISAPSAEETIPLEMSGPKG